MEIFNIFSISEPFKTGASGSGLGVPYTIQYNMSVMGTELDGTRYLRNYGKGGNPFNAEAFASNHIFLNGTTQSVPYPVLHTLSADLNTTSNPTLVNSDEITTFTATGADSFDLAVTVVGTSASDPQVVKVLTTSPAVGTVLILKFDAVVTSGSCILKRINISGDKVVDYTVTTGRNYLELTNTIENINSVLQFNGTNLFDISVTNWTVKEITLPTASYLSVMQADGTIKQFSADGDSGSTLAVSTVHSETSSHQFVFNSTSPLSADDVTAIEADANTAFRMFFDGEVLPLGFSNTDVGWFSGGNEGLASAEKVYDLSDQTFLTYVSIVGYDAATRTTLANQSKAATNLKLIQDGSGRTTGTAVANTTQWKADGRTAVTNWTITAPFTIGEIIDGEPYVFTSNGDRFKNLIFDGTYTIPTGVWTLDEFGFDGVTPVTVRGVTGMIDEVLIP